MWPRPEGSCTIHCNALMYTQQMSKQAQMPGMHDCRQDLESHGHLLSMVHSLHNRALSAVSFATRPASVEAATGSLQPFMDSSGPVDPRQHVARNSHPSRFSRLVFYKYIITSISLRLL